MKKYLKLAQKCLLLNVADGAFFAFCLLCSVFLKDITYSIDFSYADVFVIYGVLIYFILRATLARIIVKRVWFPNLFSLAELILLALITNAFDLTDVFNHDSIILLLVLFFGSVLISLITHFIIWLLHIAKEPIDKPENAEIEQSKG